MSYEIDLWGRVRRTVEAARHEAQATAADSDRPAQSSRPSSRSTTFELRRRRRPEQLPGRDGSKRSRRRSSSRRIARGRRGPEVRRRPGPDTRSTPRGRRPPTSRCNVAQLEHAIATLIGKPPAAFGLSPRPLATPASGHPGGHAVPAAGVGGRTSRPPSGGSPRQRADRHRQAATNPTVHAETPRSDSREARFGNLFNASSSSGPSARRSRKRSSRGRRRANLRRRDRRLRWRRSRATVRPRLSEFSAGRDSLAALRILEQEAQEQRRRRAVGRAIAPACSPTATAASGQLPSG